MPIFILILLEFWEELKINEDVESLPFTKFSPYFRNRQNKTSRLLTPFALRPIFPSTLPIRDWQTLYRGSQGNVSGLIGTMVSLATAQISVEGQKLLR